eukprot:TRINITY_DN42689_c0_g1_i1.p1 TRINITY_DN42689_c0_g1~~TRINITY_DN42689_c0_g1_i1.p1  ORF type:complete len:425 (-),score=58.90 TRINITY_DN42689_c0_g1_i1:84-1268(-)
MTSLGGSRMDPRVLAAMDEASRSFVSMPTLLTSAGKAIGKLAKVPKGYTAGLTTGAAASLAICTMACMARNNPELLPQLPNTKNFTKNTVVIDGGSDFRWLPCVSLTGAQLRPVGSEGSPMRAAGLRASLSPEVACVLIFAGGLPPGEALDIAEVVSIAHAAGVPVVVDAAAQLPPRSNLWLYTEMGVDLVIFSGGKAVGGPQTSGFFLGREELVKVGLAAASPNEIVLGRVCKISKEDIVGLVTAMEIFMAGSDEAELAFWEGTVAVLMNRLRAPLATKGITLERVCPGPPDIQPNHIPRLYIHFPAEAKKKVSGKSAFYGESTDHSNPLHIDPVDGITKVMWEMVNGTPSIGVNMFADGIVINPQTLSREEAAVVADRLIAIITPELATAKL